MRTIFVNSNVRCIRLMIWNNGTGYAVANEKHYDAWGKVRYDGGTGSSGQNLDASFDPYFGEGG